MWMIHQRSRRINWRYGWRALGLVFPVPVKYSELPANAYVFRPQVQVRPSGTLGAILSHGSLHGRTAGRHDTPPAAAALLSGKMGCTETTPAGGLSAWEELRSDRHDRHTVTTVGGGALDHGSHRTRLGARSREEYARAKPRPPAPGAIVISLPGGAERRAQGSESAPALTVGTPPRLPTATCSTPGSST
jgi:hypothetical protein